jgi:hypothetical protein
MENETAEKEVEFETSSEKNARKVFAIIKKINTQSAEFWENYGALQPNRRSSKLSLGKKLLCCLKIF